MFFCDSVKKLAYLMSFVESLFTENFLDWLSWFVYGT